MAAVPEVQTVNIIVNGIELAVPKGELVVEAVKRVGFEIPIFCYHPRMKPVGMCRMCLVMTGMKQPDGTIRMMPKPAAACTLPVSEGLVVDTESEAVKRDRKGVLEFLLVNHPLDCPICDRGGECPLQNNTLFYGPSTSRFVEMKRHAHKAFPLSEYVTLDLERCIQCARCVRFTEEISGDAQLAFRFRGSNTQPITFDETRFTSKFSGNVIEICPVGALTNRKSRFRARPWDLQTSEAICTNCSAGCAVWFDHRVGKFARLNGRTNEAINEEWTCDRGKFGHDHYNDDKRMLTPFIRVNDQLEKTDWSTVTRSVLDTFAGMGNEAGLILGSGVSNEGGWNALRFFREHVQTGNIDSRFEAFAPKRGATFGEVTGNSPVSNSIASYEGAKSVIIFDTDLSASLPMLYLRVRKAWFNKGAKVYVVSENAQDADGFATGVIRCSRDKMAAVAAFLASSVSAEEASRVTGISASSLDQLEKALDGAAIITTSEIYDLKHGGEIALALDRAASEHNGSYNLYARGANERGLQLMEAYPEQNFLSAREMLLSAANGGLKALWLIDVDPFESGLPREMVIEALENVEHLVVQCSTRSEAFYYASVALPMTLQAECDGSYTNMDGTVQEMKAVIPAPGESKPVWRVFEELSARLHPKMPNMTAAAVRELIPALR